MPCKKRWLVCSLGTILVASAGSPPAVAALGTITVTSSGVWVNPVTGPDSVYSGVGTSTVSWGTPQSGSFSSQLTFGALANQVAPEQEFKLGTFILRNGTIDAGTGINGISLDLTIEVDSQPLSLLQDFTVVNTANTGTPLQNADSVKMVSPASGAVNVGGFDYTLTVLGFMVVGSGDGASPAMHTLSAFEGATVATELWAVLSGGECTGPTVLKPIYFGFGCPPGGTQGNWSRVAQSGESLTGRCKNGEYTLCYTDIGGLSTQVGRCPYVEGCNGKSYVYVEVGGEISCFVKTRWRSYDAGGDDDGDTRIDIANYNFLTADGGDLDESVVEHDYNPPAPPLDCGRLGEQVGAALGPGGPAKPAAQGTGCDARREDSASGETRGGSGGMEEVGSILCDLDSDGDCDPADRSLIQGALGECLGDPGYLPAADIDGNGCVGPLDDFLLFGQDIDIDGIPDAQDNCPENFNPDQADADGNLIGDACQGIFSDGFESGDAGAWSSVVTPLRAARPATE